MISNALRPVPHEGTGCRPQVSMPTFGFAPNSDNGTQVGFDRHFRLPPFPFSLLLNSCFAPLALGEPPKSDIWPGRLLDPAENCLICGRILRSISMENHHSLSIQRNGQVFRILGREENSQAPFRNKTEVKLAKLIRSRLCYFSLNAINHD
jgi:hypothetical protein